MIEEMLKMLNRFVNSQERLSEVLEKALSGNQNPQADGPSVDTRQQAFSFPEGTKKDEDVKTPTVPDDDKEIKNREEIKLLLNEREIPFNARCATATLAKLLETGTAALTQKAKDRWEGKADNVKITSVEGTQETPEEQDDFLAWDKEEQVFPTGVGMNRFYLNRGA